MKRLLVTGGAGFIGSNFVRYILRTQPDASVVTLDALTYAGSLHNLESLPDPGRHAFIQGDIRDQELVYKALAEQAIDTIVHFAAESHVDRSIHGPEAFIDTNVTGTLSLLQAARLAWADSSGGLFLHISTDEVFGSLAPDEPTFNESTAYRPNSPYAASKAAADHLVRAFGHSYGLPVIIANCSNNYGPHQFPEKLVPLVILNAFDGAAIPVYGDGLQIRDWLYVEDMCAGLWAALERGRPGGTYLFGGGNQPTNLELLERLCAELDRQLPDSPHRPHASLMTHIADRPGHDRRYALDSSKAADELGWRPVTSLKQGLRSTVGWYLENQTWVEAVRSQPAYRAWLNLQYLQEAE